MILRLLWRLWVVENGLCVCVWAGLSPHMRPKVTRRKGEGA